VPRWSKELWGLVQAHSVSVVLMKRLALLLVLGVNDLVRIWRRPRYLQASRKALALVAFWSIKLMPEAP